MPPNTEPVKPAWLEYIPAAAREALTTARHRYRTTPVAERPACRHPHEVANLFTRAELRALRMAVYFPLSEMYIDWVMLRGEYAEPVAVVPPPSARPASGADGLPVPITRIPMASVKRKPLRWLWRAWMPLGKLFCLDGDPNLGKSTILLDLAARVSTDGVMPDGSQGVTGKVIILSAEDDIDDTILPRLLTAGADLSQIECLYEVDHSPPSLPRDRPQLRRMVEDLDARLVIIDPLMAYLSVNAHVDQEVREALHPLKQLAGECGCLVAYLRHLNKGGGTKAIYRGGGSIGIIGAARAAALVATDPDDDSRQVFAHSKWNLSTRQQSLLYTLDYVEQFDACRVNWLDERSPYTADDLLRPAKTTEEKEQAGESKSALDFAAEWLTDYLRQGPAPVTDCKAAAKKVGIAPRTLERAAGQACGKPRKLDGVWRWQLGPEVDPIPD